MGDDREVDLRLGILVGETIDRRPDDELDQHVGDAMEAAQATCARVTLLLKHVVLVRATRGALGQSSTDGREPCELVVEAREPVTLDDDDPRAALLAMRGARSYGGVPLWIGGVVVGALEVFLADQVLQELVVSTKLKPIALACSARLAELARSQPLRPRDQIAITRIAFESVWKELVPLEQRLETARKSLEVLTADALALRGQSARALDDLRDATSSLRVALRRHREGLANLEHFVGPPDAYASVDDIVRVSSRLVTHVTSAVGGVRWTVDPAIAEVIVEAAPPTCIGLVAHALVAIASRCSPAGGGKGLDAVARGGRSAIELSVAAPLARSQFDAIAKRIDDLVSHPRIQVEAADDAVHLYLPAA